MSFALRVPAHLPPVTADRRRIVQVLLNLLTNAARHSPESSAIRLSAARDGVHGAFSVADDGVGIAPERLPCLFRRFSGGEGEEQGSFGAGLGLAICRGIVEAHGGRIWAERGGSGLGARFTFGPSAAGPAWGQGSPSPCQRSCITSSGLFMADSKRFGRSSISSPFTSPCGRSAGRLPGQPETTPWRVQDQIQLPH